MANLEERREKRRKINEEHAKNPKVGDVWVEIFCVIFVICARPTKNHVLICSAKRAVDSSSWTWDLEKLELLTVSDLDKKVRYGSIPGFWCECHPEAHKWVAEALGAA